MHQHPLDLVRLFLSLFQDLPPVSRTLYIPGAVVLIGYPVLAVVVGPDQQAQAFVTAFLVALALRIAIGFEGMVRRLLTRYSVPAAVGFAVLMAGLPLAILTLADHPLWCQRVQSGFYLVIGAIFLMDVLKGRVSTAASFWPGAEMRDHLPNLTRMMVVYNVAFLLLNETLIRTVDASHWLMFWAVLPVIGHMVLRALVLTVINLDDSGQPV